MAKIETMVSCPFCRRVYKMMLDRAMAKERGTRASCGRCGNSFELAARVVVTMNSNVGTGVAGGPRAGTTMPPPPPARAPAAGEVVEAVAPTDIESDEASSSMPAVAPAVAEFAVSSPTVRETIEPMAPMEAAAIDSFPTPPPAAEVATESQPAIDTRPGDWLDRADPGLCFTRPEPDAVVAMTRLLP